MVERRVICLASGNFLHTEPSFGNCLAIVMIRTNSRILGAPCDDRAMTARDEHYVGTFAFLLARHDLTLYSVVHTNSGCVAEYMDSNFRASLGHFDCRKWSEAGGFSFLLCLRQQLTRGTSSHWRAISSLPTFQVPICYGNSLVTCHPSLALSSLSSRFRSLLMMYCK